MTPTERAKTVLRRIREIRQQKGVVRERDWIREIKAQIDQALASPRPTIVEAGPRTDQGGTIANLL